VPVYFASDMHLRLDHPERGARLGRFVGGLDGSDTLYLVGDVCDFWYVARQQRRDPLDCAGLRALVGFRRRGGNVVILPGNHDHWLGPFYQRVLGVGLTPEPLVVDAHGLRFHVTHGHKAGGRPPWKAVMESRAFLGAFNALPGPAAGLLDVRLNLRNDQARTRDEARLLAVYQSYVGRLDPAVDVAVFGHVHSPSDRAGRPRVVVLGGWHDRSSYLRVDDAGARLVIEPAA